MSQRRIYSILPMGLIAVAALAITARPAAAQQAANTPTQAEMYCGGFVSDKTAPPETYVISGENSDYRNIYVSQEDVYINEGADKGVKVGDEFDVIRPEQDLLQYPWFKWQAQLVRAMGIMYSDIGRVRVVNVQAKTSVAEIELSCDGMQRGDLVRPFTPRITPAFHQAAFDQFAAPSGKKMAMIVTTRYFGQAVGEGTTVYVNLGSAQGVQVGDYFRAFRYQGTNYDTAYQSKYTAFKAFGFGSAPVAYHWDNLPRQVLGEGIVIRTGANSSTVLITTSHEEMYAGDYVEVE